MPQPYDYGIRQEAIPSPVQGFLGALQVVQQMQQQKAAQEQAQNRQQVLGRLAALGTKATADDYVKASLELPGDRELFKQNWDIIEPAKQDAVFNGGAEAYMLADKDPVAAKAKLEEWALGFENAGDKEHADKFRTAAKMVEHDPQAAKATIGMMLSFADGERFKNVVQPSEATTFQKDFSFIKDTFGDDAAAEFAQYGRDNIVSIPLGNGQTYVGPASSAPGSSRWQERGGVPPPAQAAAKPTGVVDIMDAAAAKGFMTQAEYDVIKGVFGAAGKSALETWKGKNKVKIVVRTGMENGRRVVQYEDGTIGYAGDGGGNATGGFP